MNEKQLEERIDSLSVSERWRLLRWLARRYPAEVKAGVSKLRPMGDAAIAVKTIGYEPSEEVREFSPPAGMG